MVGDTARCMSRGAIFHHFDDKDALFLALAHDDAAAPLPPPPPRPPPRGGRRSPPPSEPPSCTARASSASSPEAPATTRGCSVMMSMGPISFAGKLKSAIAIPRSAMAMLTAMATSMEMT